MSAVKPGERFHTRLGASFVNAVPVVPSDATEYEPPLQALYVGTAGNVVVQNVFGDVVTYTNLSGWAFVQVKKVLAASTAAAIVGLW